jgi:hypothetical protein
MIDRITLTREQRGALPYAVDWRTYCVAEAVS